MSNRAFVIYTADGQLHAIKAPSLRTALRNFGGKPESIVAAVDETCLPEPREEARPFVAVFLQNKAFTAPGE